VIGFPKDHSAHDRIEKIFKPVVDAGRSFIIVKHDPKDAPNIPCEYPELHYHGITNQRGVDIRNERCWQRVRDCIKECDGYFKSQRVFSLPALCAYLQMPGKEVLIDQLRDNMRDVWSAVTDADIQKQVKKKTERAIEKKEKSCDINTLRQFMLDSGAFTETEILHKYLQNETFISIFKKKNFGLNLDKAKQLASQQIIEMSVEDLFGLARKRVYDPEKYLTPEESLDVIKNWCRIQGIPLRKFVGDLYQFMDRGKKKVNTFWMHGISNAGKSYIARSMQQLAVLTHSVPPGSNRFMWQDCINKRLIVVNEPYLDEAAVESCKEIMEGNGAYVPVKNKPDQFLRSTPVFVTSNTYLWAMSPQAKGPLMSRVYPGYIDLKPAPFLKDVTKELHPLWLEQGVAEITAADHGQAVLDDEALPSINELFDDTAPAQKKTKMTMTDN
jgi:Parvovirus non-structural protein NS1